MKNRVREVLANREPAMLALIEELVAVNSFTENVAGGRAVGEILARELGGIAGMSVRVAEAKRSAPHLVASTRAAAASPAGSIAIVGHLDTVFPPGVFEGFRRDGNLARGPGVLDMKGGLAVVIEALRALAEVGALDAIPIRFVIVGDEEVGSPEGRPFIQTECQGAASALVLEAGREHDAVITARKGTGAVTAIANGRAAHAGNGHHLGANAIWALARFIDRAQSLTDYERGLTVNVGKIAGGQGKNTVPDRAEAQIDFRYVRIADGESMVTALADAAAEASRGIDGTSVLIEGGIARSPLERTDASVALYREYAACARDVGLGDGEAPLIGGGSDASSTAAIGIPSIDGLGPRGSGFHTKEELIEVATLVPKAQAIAAFLVGRTARG